MVFRLPVITFFVFSMVGAQADLPSLVSETDIRVIAQEVSGVSAKRNLDTVTLFHRMRASREFRQAAEHVLGKLREYGYDDAQIIDYPADGKTMFGTQKSRLAWNVEFAELWELNDSGERLKRHGHWESMPLSLAQDSVSGSARAALVDIGTGMVASDYAGKEIAGRLVLTSSQPGVVAARAVGEHAAAGIISYAPNQKSAWWKEDDRLVRWGHLDGFEEPRTFAFMISLGAARQLQARLAEGEEIELEANVRATLEPGRYSLVTAVIPGSDPRVGKEEILFSCHLDHPRPGANDNASGCVSILETARTLRKLIDEGALPAPKRSLRFIWPAEIEGSIIYLADLGDTGHIRANVHLDMVGGNQQTKSVFRISGGPMSLPSFVGDVAHEIGHFVNAQTLAYASGEPAEFSLVSKEGTKNPQLAVMEDIDLGSDHQCFNESSWGIPGIYLHDWPDRYIHTNFDTAAMIDPTKLKRAAFIAALQGWYLANFGEEDVEPLLALLRANALQRARGRMLALPNLDPADRMAALKVHFEVELGKVRSIGAFVSLSLPQLEDTQQFLRELEALSTPKALPLTSAVRDERVYARNPELHGPMHGFGYSWIIERLGKEAFDRLRLTGEHAYEALNLVDGQRTVSEIRDWLVAEFGEADEEAVAEYVEALERAGAIRRLQ